jgi:hypothetical protein
VSVEPVPDEIEDWVYECLSYPAVDQLAALCLSKMTDLADPLTRHELAKANTALCTARARWSA